MHAETMKLIDKGLVRPAPKLGGPAARVAETIASWPNVIAATHWHLSRKDEINGADFYVGEAELGHIHLDGEVHLATSLELRQSLIAARLARPFPWYKSWVEASIRNEDEADQALWLFRLNYERLVGGDVEAMLQKRIGRSAFWLPRRFQRPVSL
jgi:hypothetical protein